MKLRQLKMRILNDPVVHTHVLGLYPEGTSDTPICARSSLPLDLPVQELYKSVVIPDLIQLEHGVTFDEKAYFGTIHFLCGDHNELCAIAGILGAAVITFLKY